MSRGPTVLPRPAGGLVWAYVLDEAGTAAAVRDTGDLELPVNGWLWLHLDLVDTRAQDWIEVHAPVSEEARICLVQAARRQFITGHAVETYGVVADFHQEVGHTSVEVGRLSMAFTERLLITGRRHPLQAVDALRTRIEHDEHILRPSEFLVHVIEAFLSATANLTSSLADEVDDAEDRVFLSDGSEDRTRLNEIRRLSLQLHREVNGLRGAIRRYRGAPARSIRTELMQELENLGGPLEEADLELLAIQDRVRLILDELTGKAASAANRHLHTLSILTALFMPATLVTGLFGMNVKDIPFEDDVSGFWAAFIVAMTVTLGVYLYLRRKRIIG
ncbi:MAG: CorA family divalent cation transporter [Microvirga sp.]